MSSREVTITLGRRVVPVVFKAAAGLVLDFRPGDLTLLTEEEAARAIAAGVAVPARLVYEPEAKEAKP